MTSQKHTHDIIIDPVASCDHTFRQNETTDCPIIDS